MTLAMDLEWAVITAPAEEPVDLSEIEEEGRIPDDHGEGISITRKLAEARDYFEYVTGRSVMTQTLEAYADTWSDEFELPRSAPFGSLTSVKYLDTDGDEQTVAASTYKIVAREAKRARVVRAYGKSWPSARSEEGAIRIRYVAGYATANDVPASIKSAILLLAQHAYEHREPVLVGTIQSALPYRLRSLLARHSVRGMQ